MHLINKQKKNKRKSKEKMYCKYKKVCIKSLAVRAGSVRPRGLAGSIKKYVHQPGQNLLPKGADGRRRPLRGLQNQKKKGKKGKKKGQAGQKPRLSRSARFRRPESEGGVCQPGAGFGVHFLPAASRRQRGLPSMHTFCRQNCRRVSG